VDSAKELKIVDRAHPVLVRAVLQKKDGVSSLDQLILYLIQAELI